jgi:hypothetical protein
LGKFFRQIDFCFGDHKAILIHDREFNS